jgi:hypothetical protein
VNWWIGCGAFGELPRSLEIEDGRWDGNLIVGGGIHLEKAKKPCN